MKDRTKDRIEDVAAAVVEGVASAIPILGGPLAVAVNRSFGSAQQRRNERILAEIEADVVHIYEQLKRTDIDSLFQSEQFMAAFNTTFRAAQESPSEEKRKLLRNALINGYVSDSSASDLHDDFLRLMTRYQPGHVVILDALNRIMSARTETLDYAAAAITAELERSKIPIPTSLGAYLRDLVNDQLVHESTQSEIREQTVRQKYGPLRTENYINNKTRHNISKRRQLFLDLVADPFYQPS